MAKTKSGKRKLQKKDVFQRLNYLYQAAHFVISMHPTNTALAKYYVRTMVSLALKNVVRLNPHVKRTICKQCNMILLPGTTSRVRHRGKRKKNKRAVVTCLECGTTKTFLLDRNYEQWNDKPENILEIVSIDTSSKRMKQNEQTNESSLNVSSVRTNDAEEASIHSKTDSVDKSVLKVMKYLLRKTVDNVDKVSASV